MDILKYKDYEGTAELDLARGVCRGKILFINDLVTYESSSPSELQNEFESAIEDYLQTCADLGREPQKPLKGQFSVRIQPALHKAAVLKALADGTNLNDVVVRALDTFLNAKSDVNHIENKNYYVLSSEVHSGYATANVRSVDPSKKPVRRSTDFVSVATSSSYDNPLGRTLRGGKSGAH